MVQARLASPVRASDGHVLPAGSAVKLTVVSVAPAGKIESMGEVTLQIVAVGGVATLSDAQTFEGKEGHKDLPDSAPAKGTEAVVAAGTVLHFEVAPIPPPSSH